MNRFERKWWHRFWWMNPFWVWQHNKALSKQCERLADVIAGNIGISELVAQNGSIDMTLKSKELLAIFAMGCRGLLRDAPNYVEMTLFTTDTKERFIVTVQRANGKTPHDLRKEAEAVLERTKLEIEELKARSAELVAKLEGG